MGIMSRFTMNEDSIALFTSERMATMKVLFEAHNTQIINALILNYENEIIESWTKINQAIVDKDAVTLNIHSTKIITLTKDIEYMKKTNFCYGCFSFMQFEENIQKIAKEGHSYDFWYQSDAHLTMFSQYVCSEPFTLCIRTDECDDIMTVMTYQEGKCVYVEDILVSENV